MANPDHYDAAARLDWLQTRRALTCPQCERRTFKACVLKLTHWCPTCRRIWKVQVLDGQPLWRYEL